MFQEMRLGNKNNNDENKLKKKKDDILGTVKYNTRKFHIEYSVDYH